MEGWDGVQSDVLVLPARGPVPSESPSLTLTANLPASASLPVLPSLDDVLTTAPAHSSERAEGADMHMQSVAEDFGDVLDEDESCAANGGAVDELLMLADCGDVLFSDSAREQRS